MCAGRVFGSVRASLGEGRKGGKYDTDGNGNLDKDETKQFVRDTLSDMSDGAGFNDDDFDQCFREFDKDGSGTIEKTEMVQFIKQVAGL